jgi:hypothetical protein
VREDASTLKLNPTAFPNAAELKQTNNLGRLSVSSEATRTTTVTDYLRHRRRSFTIRA